MDTAGTGISHSEAEIIAAERALAHGHTAAARAMLTSAARHGAARSDIDRLLAAVRTAEARQRVVAARSTPLAFGVAALGYILLGARSPAHWPTLVWAVLAFLVVPAAAGFAAGRSLGPDSATGARVRTAGRAVRFAMLLYAAIALFVIRSRITTSPSTYGQELLAGLLVCVVYALAAGLVASLAAAFAFGPPHRVAPAAPAGGTP